MTPLPSSQLLRIKAVAYLLELFGGICEICGAPVDGELRSPIQQHRR